VSRRPFSEPTAAQRKQTKSRSQRAFSADSSRWFKRWKKIGHSGAAQVVSSDQAKKKGRDQGKANSNVPEEAHGAKDNSNARDKANAPGGWMERVAAGQA
tara:strand:- start:352 stop:651 length:300 start_codon:yes stop_codon:yes gene_type:complete